MHPTRNREAFILNLAGGRVMPGVRRLVAKHEDEWFAGRLSRKENQLRLVNRAWFSFLVVGEGASHVSCALRVLSM
jgi:hypothetical protein